MLNLRPRSSYDPLASRDLGFSFAAGGMGAKPPGEGEREARTVGFASHFGGPGGAPVPPGDGPKRMFCRTTTRLPVLLRHALLCLGLLWSLTACLSFQTERPTYPGKPFGYTDLKGIKTHYREVPSASSTSNGNVLFIHGYAGGLVSWTMTQPVLAEHYRTISFDLKGFGLTDKVDGDYSIDALSDQAADLMDQLGVDKAAVVAHSFGCAVALNLARRHPEKVTKLVLADAYVYAEQLNGFLRWAQVPWIGETLFSLFYNEQIETRFLWSYFDPERHVVARHFDALHDFQELPGIRAAALAVLRGMSLDTLSPSYPKIVQPTLLVWGREDRVSPPQVGERLLADLPNARLVVLPRSGHNVMLEQAGAFNALVAEFLAR